MSRESVLARGRAAAEAGMVDAVTIRRTTGVSTNDQTGVVTPVQTVIYTGKARIQQSIAMGQRVESGEASLVVLRLELQLPVATSTAVDRGDIVTVDSAVNDASLPGRTFVIRDLHHKSESTARRMTCEEVT